jgi:hypothetical protein
MTTLTPNNIVNNLNKNFDKIIGEAIIGYNKFYEMEQLLLNNIQTNSEQTSSISKKAIAFLETYATIVQYGKNYFLDQIITNYVEMENLTLYINTISPFFSQAPTNAVVKSSVELLAGGQKGGNNLLIRLFVSLAIQILFASLANSQNIANSISLYGQPVEVSIDIDKGKISKARSSIYGNINPLNTTQMEQKTREYGRNVVFPKDTMVNSLNLTERYSPEFISRLKGNQGFLEKFLQLNSDEQFYNLFYSNISARVEYLNSLIDIVHPALEEMCKGFVKTTDRLLPIPLYELLNSKLAMEFQRIKEKRDALIEAKIAELKSDKLKQLQITQAEPGMLDVVSETGEKISTGVSNTLTGIVNAGVDAFFYWPKSLSNSAVEPVIEDKAESETESEKPLSTQELQDIYTAVDESVNKQIQELGNSFDKEALASVVNEKLEELQEDTIDALSVTNLKIYLTAVCKIKKPRYTFNQLDGILSIKNNAWSRFHLQILAQNVVSYYDTVIKGIQSVTNNGEIFIDIPDDIRIQNLNSLLEKSQAVIPVLIEYDTGLVSSLAEGHESASNITDFFENIAKMWIDIKTPILQACEQFPETSRKKNIELTRLEEEARRNNMELERKHEMDVVQRVLIAKQKNESNQLTENDWAIFNRMIGINVGGSLNTVTTSANAIVNATTDFGTNTLENADKLFKQGFANLNSIVWGITNSGMVLCIPVLFLLALKTGLITAVFGNIKRRLQNPNNTPALPPANPPINPNLPANPPLNFNPNPNQVDLRGFTDADINDLRNALLDSDEEHGGGRSKKKSSNKKTRKNKKKITRKLKRGKRRQTKYRKKRQTKKH